jgi:hypothetical protein
MTWQVADGADASTGPEAVGVQRQLEEAALLALGQWSLDPALLDGAAEASSIDAVVEFKIPGSMP